MAEYFVTAWFTAREEQVLSVEASSAREAAQIVRANGGEVESTRTISASRFHVSKVVRND